MLKAAFSGLAVVGLVASMLGATTVRTVAQPVMMISHTATQIAYHHRRRHHHPRPRHHHHGGIVVKL